MVSSEILVTGIFYVVHNFAKSKKDRYEKENHYRIGCADINGQLSRCAGHLIGLRQTYPMVQPNNGILMPQFGLGTFFQPSDSVCEQSCLTALKAGYRHIDTAHAYNDEAGVGRAVKESGIPREEIWITSKLWPTEYGEGKTLKAIDEMLGRLQLDYIDLLYVHQPVGDFVGAWKDMEKAVAMGKVRVLGISNFDASDEVFDKIMRESVVKPAVLQMECHPYAQRLAMREKAKRYGIYVTSWFPLGGAMSKGALLKEERFFNMSLEEKERAYLGNMQIPAERK